MLANQMDNAFLIKYDKIASLASPGYTQEERNYLLNCAQDRVVLTLYNPFGNKYQQGFEMSEKRGKDLSELIRFVNILGEVESYTTLYYLEGTTNPYIYNITNNTSKGLVEGVNLYDSSGNVVGYVIAVLSNTQIRTNVTITSTITLPSGASQLAVYSGLGKSKSQVEVHTNNGLEGTMLDLPPLFLYTIEESVKTSESTGYTPVKVVTHDYVRANMRNPYKKPYSRLSWRLQFSKSVHGVGEEDNITVNNIEQYSSSNKRVEVITNGSLVKEYWCRYLKLPRRIVVNEDNPELQISCELDESIHDMIVDEAVKLATSITNPEMYSVKADQRNSSE